MDGTRVVHFPTHRIPAMSILNHDHCDTAEYETSRISFQFLNNMFTTDELGAILHVARAKLSVEKAGVLSLIQSPTSERAMGKVHRNIAGVF